MQSFSDLQRRRLATPERATCRRRSEWLRPLPRSTFPVSLPFDDSAFDSAIYIILYVYAFISLANKITAAGVKTIAEALRVNTGLTHLDLSCTPPLSRVSNMMNTLFLRYFVFSKRTKLAMKVRRLSRRASSRTINSPSSFSKVCAFLKPSVEIRQFVLMLTLLYCRMLDRGRRRQSACFYARVKHHHHQAWLERSAWHQWSFLG